MSYPTKGEMRPQLLEDMYGTRMRTALTSEQAEHLQSIRPNLADDIYDGMTGGGRRHRTARRKPGKDLPTRFMD